MFIRGGVYFTFLFPNAAFKRGNTVAVFRTQKFSNLALVQFSALFYNRSEMLH